MDFGAQPLLYFNLVSEDIETQRAVQLRGDHVNFSDTSVPRYFRSEVARLRGLDLAQNILGAVKGFPWVQNSANTNLRIACYFQYS